jgi:hypothetical protein
VIVLEVFLGLIKCRLGDGFGEPSLKLFLDHRCPLGLHFAGNAGNGSSINMALDLLKLLPTSRSSAEAADGRIPRTDSRLQSQVHARSLLGFSISIVSVCRLVTPSVSSSGTMWARTCE